MALLGQIALSSSETLRGDARRAAHTLRWIIAAALTLVLHAAVLLISLEVVRGTGDADPQPFSINVELEALASKPAVPPPVLEIPPPFPTQAPAQLVPLPAFVGGDADMKVPQPERVAQPASTNLRSTIVESRSAAPAEESGGRSGDVGGGDDSPLAAGPLDDFTSSAGGASGGGSGKGGGTGSGIGSGGTGGSGTGTGTGSGKGFGGALDRAAGALRSGAPREALRLPGKPTYPRSCRQGLCRGGEACEGSSEWKVFVDRTGGKPTKVECVKPMACELQNAAIRKYFQQAEFPKTEQPSVYVFPVRMFVQDER